MDMKEPPSGSRLPRSLMLRLEPGQALLIEEAYLASRYKTRQAMISAVLFPALKALLEQSR